MANKRKVKYPHLRRAAREMGVRMKHSPNREVLAGKRVVLIDDSIVRGTTSIKIIEMPDGPLRISA